MAWYLDILLDRREGGTEVSGPQRWVVDANWKTAAENFGGDGYHIASTHGSARELGIDTTTSKTRQWNKGCQIACDNGHILVSWLTPPDSGPWFAQPDDQLADYMKEHEVEIESRLGTKRARQISPSAGTVFRPEELSRALNGVATAVRGGVVGGIENGVAGGIVGGTKVESKETRRSTKQPPVSAFGLAMNQTPGSPAQQAGSAKLFGTVSDASQARVPNATLVISAKEGGIKEITISSAAGEYEFRTLPLGRYTIEVRTLGFRSFQQALELHANEPRKLDVVLEVGEVDQMINVVAKAPPAAPPDTRSGPPSRIRVGGNVQQTKLVHQVTPIYPERAQAQGIQGVVLLEAVILKDGSIGAMRVLNKLADPDLVTSAVEAVKNWRYEPTLLNGQPIEVVTTITVNFRLSSS